jgi:hypothetical protein
MPEPLLGGVKPMSPVGGRPEPSRWFRRKVAPWVSGAAVLGLLWAWSAYAAAVGGTRAELSVGVQRCIEGTVTSEDPGPVLVRLRALRADDAPEQSLELQVAEGQAARYVMGLRVERARARAFGGPWRHELPRLAALIPATRPERQVSPDQCVIEPGAETFDFLVRGTAPAR